MTAARDTQLLAITQLRDRAALALAPIEPDDPPVLVDVVDSLSPPALMLLWGDPWLNPQPQRVAGGCLFNARLHVLCVAGRLEPGPGIRVIEQLVTHTILRLAGDAYTWPFETATAPRVFDLAGLAYLGARVSYLIPTTIALGDDLP